MRNIMLFLIIIFYRTFSCDVYLILEDFGGWPYSSLQAVVITERQPVSQTFKNRAICDSAVKAVLAEGCELNLKCSQPFLH
jgi:hypothetical protein